MKNKKYKRKVKKAMKAEAWRRKLRAKAKAYYQHPDSNPILYSTPRPNS